MSDLRNPAPRPWYGNNALAVLVRDRYARRHESALRWAEWANVADELRAELAAGAAYPADVAGLVSAPDQLPLWSIERRAA